MVYVVATGAANSGKHARIVLANRAYLDTDVQQIETSVPTLAALSALTGLAAATGSLVWVESLHRAFVKDATATPLVPGQVVTASGGGVWRSLSGYSEQASYWASRTDWHIDATGSVEGVGSAADPISSWAELLARIGGQVLPVGITISIESDLAEVIDARSLIAPAGGVVITGDPGATTLATGTVAAYSPENLVGPGGEGPLVTSNDIADWTPWLARRCRMTSGAATGSLFWPLTVSPGGAPTTVARVTRPVQPNYTRAGSGTRPALAVGTTFAIEQLPVVQGFLAPDGVSGSNYTYNGGGVLLRGVQLSSVNYPNALRVAGNLWLVGCRCPGEVLFAGGDIMTGEGCLFGTNSAGFARFDLGPTTLLECGFLGAVTFSGRSVDCRYSICECNGASGVSLATNVTLLTFGVFGGSTASGAIHFTAPAGLRLFIHNPLYGYGNQYGILLLACTSVAYESGSPPIMSTTAPAPSNFSFGVQVADPKFDWPSLPQVDAARQMAFIPSSS